MDKSHVGLGHEVCPVCGKEHTESVLLDKLLRNTLTRHKFTGWSMCPECKTLQGGGYIALVEVSNATTPTLENADRTGIIAHVKASVWEQLFNTPVPNRGLCFVEVGVIGKLK